MPLVGYLVFLARKWLLSHTSPKQFAALAGLARQVVESAEQVAKGTQLSNAEKYGLAAETLTTLARRLGVKLKATEVNSFIEAAVKAMKADDKYLALP